MGGNDEDTTYSYVEPSSKRKTAKTVQQGTVPPVSDEPAEDTARSHTDVDPSRHKLSHKDVAELLERGKYQQVCDMLGPAERAEELPPILVLMYIVARGELDQGPALADLPHLAMETCGKVLDSPASSRVSRLMAKRLLGLSSADVRGRMPATAARIGLIVGALVLGVVVGWVIHAAFPGFSR